jgi:hypothetical protein
MLLLFNNSSIHDLYIIEDIENNMIESNYVLTR